MALGELYKPYRSVAAWYMWRACEHCKPAVDRKAEKKVVAKKSVAKKARKKAMPKRASLSR
jgi:hypothetical protein